MGDKMGSRVPSPEIPLTKIDKSEANLDNPNAEKEILRVEDIYDQLGGFSRFQFFATVIILCLEIPGAMVALSPILTTTSHVDFYCEKNDSSINLLSKDDLCNGKCIGDVVAKQPFKSIVQEWNLICDQAWISDSLTSLFMVGSALGPLITAQIADRFGRKPAFFMICALLGASGIFASQSTTIPMYAVSKLFSGIAAGGCMVAHMNYLMEFLTPSWRIICGCVSMWPVGEMLLALAGYLSPDWRTLSWISIVPAFLLMLAMPWLAESPRWLLVKKETKKAGAVLKTISKWNNRSEISPETLHLLQESVIKSDSENEKESFKNRWAAFTDRKILMRISIFFLAWFANALTYYGISFNMKNIDGNQYLNVFLLGVLDAPAELSGMYFSNRFGRKLSFIGFLLLSVICLVAVAGIQLLSDEESIKMHFGIVILILCLTARFFNETSFAIMTCFTGESFPTVIRSICFSICTIASSVGGIVSPQMAYLGTIWGPGPYIIFCVTCTISCLFSLKLTETRKMPLHDIH